MPGDVNNQDNINNADAQWLLEHLAQKTGKQSGTEQGYTLEQFKEQCKVVNPSGTVFSCADASYIYSHVKEQGSATNYPITLPEPEPAPGNGSYQFANTTALQTAVNLWVSDKPTTLSTYGEINTWDTSLVTNMNLLFKDKATFNDDISNWNTSNVTNMEGMFWGATAFNQPINTQQVTVNGNTYTAWNVSNVTNMYMVFYKATSFNQPIGSWDVSNVTNMAAMFNRIEAFNQPINTQQVTVNNNTYTAWDVSNVTTMYIMFYEATAFNQPIGSWDVSNVIKMEYMFHRTAFNQPIGSWNTSNVTNMYGMFYEATAFNQPIGSWNTSNVNYMRDMFNEATAFNQPINTQQVTVNNNTYTAWDVSKVTRMSWMFSGAYAFNQEIGNWNVSNVSGMEYMFKQATAFNQDISNWDVSSVTNFDLMFSDATLMNASPWNAPDTPDASWFTIPEPDSAAGVPTGSTPTSTVQFYYNNNNFIPVQTTLINTYALTDISSINIISAKMGGESINGGTPIAADVIAAGNLGEWYFGITEPNNHTYCQTVKIKFNINTSGYITIQAVRARWMPPGQYDHNIALNILWDNNVGISQVVVDGVNVPGYGVKNLYIEYQV